MQKLKLYLFQELMYMLPVMNILPGEMALQRSGKTGWLLL